MDLFSVAQGGKVTYSFVSQAFGVMAELDLGTESLRWMGDARFTVGYIQGALGKKRYPLKVEVKVVGTTNKVKMAEQYNVSWPRPVADIVPLAR